MRQSMGFPSHRFLLPSIKDLVMESRKDGTCGRRGVPRGTLVLSPHRTLATLPPPQAAPQHGMEQQGHRQSPTLPGGGGAGGPRSYPPGGTVPLACLARPHVLATRRQNCLGTVPH